MKSRKGRPPKYCTFVAALELEELYSPALVVDAGARIGLMPAGLSEMERKRYRKRVRQAMSRLATRLPEQPDGSIKIPGQEPSRAWFGWRWKQAFIE